MDWLADDLLLLSIKPDKGYLATADRIDYGLMGSELVRLAMAGRIDIRKDRVIVLSQAPTGDEQLDAALASLAGARRPPRAQAWVARPRRGIRQAYLNRLIAAGLLRPERVLLFGTRYVVTDRSRVAAARFRLDQVALGTGPVDTVQTAYGGLAHAVGLGWLLYRGRAGKQARRRLEQIARGQVAAAAVTQAATSAAAGSAASAAASAAAAASTDAAAQAAADAASSAVAQAASHAAAHAAAQAAAHAAAQASARAASEAATQAASRAASDAAAEAARQAGIAGPWPPR